MMQCGETLPDWFVAQDQVKLWHDYYDYFDANEIIKWYDGY